MRRTYLWLEDQVRVSMGMAPANGAALAALGIKPEAKSEAPVAAAVAAPGGATCCGGKGHGAHKPVAVGAK